MVHVVGDSSVAYRINNDSREDGAGNRFAFAWPGVVFTSDQLFVPASVQQGKDTQDYYGKHRDNGAASCEKGAGLVLILSGIEWETKAEFAVAREGEDGIPRPSVHGTDDGLHDDG